jgi:Leucine-rich repeat (LRR) protein
MQDMGAKLSVNVLGNSIGVEPAQELINILQAKDKRTTLCGFSGDETELDLSNKNLSAGCAVLVANEISDMGAISSVDVLGNSIGVEQAQELINILQAKDKLTTLCGFSGDETELDLRNKNLSAGCAVLVANEISDMRALSSLILKSNSLCNKEAGKALAEMLVANTVLTELDLSSNYDRYSSRAVEFAQELAVGIRDNGALSVLSLRSNNLATKEAGRALAMALATNSVLKELDVSNNLDGRNAPYTQTDGAAFAQELAVGIRNNGAISSVNLLKNDMGTDQAKAMVSILKEHPTLKYLCGNTGDETELDMSGKMEGAADAIMLVPEIIDNGAMTSLDVSKCKLTMGTTRKDEYKTRTDEEDYYYEVDMSGIIALSNAIKDMRAMTSLNLASNKLGAVGAKIVAEAIKVTKFTPAIVLAPFSCPSDFSIHCCCLLLSAGYEGNDRS